MAELKNSIVKSNESAAGPDNVYYQFLRYLPESCLHTLLKLFNNIWTTGDIPHLGGRLRWFQFQNPDAGKWPVTALVDDPISPRTKSSGAVTALP
ncbi:hypothetical protein PoB_004019600 [Plakobranchus ocellatus]|uniref:Uncharacterized protein n=1 Tax=Plakobranchus ocellatus TaxID=259542 RepID=A0AAV4ARA9_9GAST|nr:hypothetical protein PoB_004019600 [Plakobranchus ocellatus]